VLRGKLRLKKSVLPQNFKLELYKYLYICHQTAKGNPTMDVMTYTEARANLKGVMDRVVSDRTQVVVTRQKSEAVVMMSLADWNAVEETLHLLSTPTNAARLRGSIEQLEAGKGIERQLSHP
jgi:antitoxin YefM